MASVTRIGLTGGIGSGKSTVSRMLGDRAIAVIDADAIARRVTAHGGRAIDAIGQEFGTRFIAPDGALDRERMRSLAFADPTARRRLERIVHPLVSEETAREADAAVAAGHQTVVFDVPLLAESAHWRQRVDRVLVVDCREETQIARVVARNGMTAEAVRQIIAAQAPRTTRLAAADSVICNDGVSLDQLRAQVDRFAAYFGL
jgi:dephospho-CoA kinase